MDAHLFRRKKNSLRVIIEETMRWNFKEPRFLEHCMLQNGPKNHTFWGSLSQMDRNWVVCWFHIFPYKWVPHVSCHVGTNPTEPVNPRLKPPAPFSFPWSQFSPLVTNPMPSDRWAPPVRNHLKPPNHPVFGYLRQIVSKLLFWGRFCNKCGSAIRLPKKLWLCEIY